MNDSTKLNYPPREPEDWEQEKLEEAAAMMEADGIARVEAELSKPVEVAASTSKKEKREVPPNTGSLFKNDKKSLASHPDITGSALVGGAEYWVSGWRKVSAKGDFYSLSFKQKDVQASSSDLI